MTRSVWVLLLCDVLLCGSITFAATRRPAPARVESAYTLSLHVSDSDVWLGAPGQGFAQAAEMVVRVLDAQGQPVDSVPVEFSVAPSWTHTEGSPRAAAAIFIQPTPLALYGGGRAENRLIPWTIRNLRTTWGAFA